MSIALTSIMIPIQATIKESIKQRLIKFGAIKISGLVTSKKTGKWCQIPYPNHRNGCPNYGKKHYCPPSATSLIDILDLERPIYIVHSEFNLGNHITKIRIRHPQWTNRQLRNVLYWQGTSRKQLRGRVELAQYITGCNFVSYCPEGQGINVYATCLKNGLKLERIRHLNVCRHVALMGFKIQEFSESSTKLNSIC